MKSPSLLSRLIRRPVAASMIVSSLSILGSVAIFKLPLGLLPNVSSPGVTVLTRYPGVSSDAIERTLTIPIERELREVAAIEQMLSASSDGESRVHLIFQPETDVDIRILDIREKLFLLQDRFPREVESPSVLRYDPSERPVFIVSFAPPEKSETESRTRTLRQLRDFVEFHVKPRFERIQGVSEVFVGGGSEREIQVQLDPQRLLALNLSGQEIAGVVDDGNSYIPSGHIGKRQSLIYTDAKLNSLQEIADLLLPRAQNRDRQNPRERNEISLKALARITDTEREPTSLSLSDGEERITLYVQKAGDANTLSVTDQCELEVEAITARSSEMKPHTVYNQGNQIKEAISQVVAACIGGAFLAVSILHLFLRRAGFTLVIGIAIPASLLTTFFLMFLFNLELNVMSLSGLALGAGMLIDSSIVVSEACAKALTGRTDNTESIERAVGSVRGEIFASTMSTIIVFLPLFFAEYETRSLYRDFTLTVSFSLLTSMVFSLTVLPAFLIPAASLHARGITISPWSLLHRITPLVSRFQNSQWIQISYWIDHYCNGIQKKKAGALALFASCLFAPALFLLLDREYMARTESDMIEASIDLDPGIHLEKTHELIQRIENRIRTHDSVLEINAKIESSHGTLTIKLNPDASASETIAELQALTDGNTEAYIHYERGGEQINSQELELEFFGENVQEMKVFASGFADTIQSEIPAVDRVILRFRDGRRDLVLHPHRVKADLSGVSIATIGTGLRQLLQGNVITKYYDSTPGAEREIDVRVKAPNAGLESPDDILALHIPGIPAPLKTLTRPVFEESETRIFRKNRRRTVSLLVRFNGNTETVARNIRDLLDRSILPRETVAAFGDSFQKTQKNQHQMIQALLLSIVLIYLLLAFLFENFIDPLIVLLSIPISLSSVFFLLFLINRPLNLSVYIGLIMLGGIVVNNAILILAEVRSLPPGWKSARDPVQAAFRRLRPILMTTATTVLGMIPLLFSSGSQSGLWNSLAITVTTGLLFSMPAVLFLVPFCTYWQNQYRNM